MKHNTLAYTVLFLLPALAACGQTGLTNPGNTSSASLVSGTIQAMSSDRSSITVAGQSIKLSGLSAASLSRASLSSANLGTQAAPTKKVLVNGKSAGIKALSVGQKVKVYVTAGAATEVDVDLELRGQVGSIDTVAGTLVVAGKTVSVSSGTRFDLGGGDDSATTGTGSLADIKVNDFIEVTGVTNATSGVIAATKIEVRTAKELNDGGEDNHTEFRGAVSGFVTGATSFMLKTVTVNCTGTCVLPTGLKDGDAVEVDGTLSADGLTLTATRISIHGAQGGKGEGHHDGEAAPALGSTVALQDEVRGLNVASSSFNLDGLTVDYTGVTVSGGTLANDVHVKVDGTVDSSNAWLVHATAVAIVVGAPDHGGPDGGEHGLN